MKDIACRVRDQSGNGAPRIRQTHPTAAGMDSGGPSQEEAVPLGLELGEAEGIKGFFARVCLQVARRALCFFSPKLLI